MEDSARAFSDPATMTIVYIARYCATVRPVIVPPRIVNELDRVADNYWFNRDYDAFKDIVFARLNEI